MTDNSVSERDDVLTAAMDNVLAWRLGEALGRTAKQSAGDYIDRGLALLKELREGGFGLVKLANDGHFIGQHPRTRAMERDLTASPSGDLVQAVLREVQPHIRRLKAIACAEGDTAPCRKQKALLARIDGLLSTPAQPSASQTDAVREGSYKADGEAQWHLAHSLRAAGKKMLLIQVNENSYTVSIDAAARDALRATPSPLATDATRTDAMVEVEQLRARLAELEKAARYIRPYLDWTISDESPGYHPTMPSAVAAFKESFGANALDSRKAIEAALDGSKKHG